MMVPDREIRGAALLGIRRYSADAGAETAQHADDLDQEGRHGGLCDVVPDPGSGTRSSTTGAEAGRRQGGALCYQG